MKIINASYEIMDPKIEMAKDYIYKKIERVGRTCYKSEDKITEDSAAKFISGLVKRQHEAMLEHASMTVKFIVDRGVSHEMVRHRMASFAQESTRYCNYSKDKFGGEITFIEPLWFQDGSFEKAKSSVLRMKNGDMTLEEWDKCHKDKELMNKIWEYMGWYDSCSDAELQYKDFIDKYHWTPEMARSILPNSLKTEVIVTANMREWRHILNLRAAGTTGKPHPQIAEVMVPLCGELAEYMPELFNDIYVKCLWGE